MQVREIYVYKFYKLSKFKKERTMERTVKICIGLNQDNMIVFAELNLRTDYFSVTHDTLRELLTEEQGEDRAKEYLEDGELWKQAVESGDTRSSLEDWNEEVLDVDGWEHVIDARYFGELEGQAYYSTWDSFGASIDDFKGTFSPLLIEPSELSTIIESDRLHLLEPKKYKKEHKELLKKVLAIMDKYENQKDYEPLLIEKYLQY